MQSLKSVLDSATGEGLISTEQAGRLLPYMEARGVVLARPQGGGALDIAGPADRIVAPVEDTEAPRFVRGFHDVLITIGVAIAMAGVWGIGAFVAALPAIILLAEVLVKRQRLALPAVLLTLLFVHWIFVTMVLARDEFIGKPADPFLDGLLIVLPFVLLLPLFHWRYRVPLALSFWFLSLAAAGLSLVFFVLARLMGSADIVTEHPMLSAGIFLAAALALFAVAMIHDLSDRLRVTRRSDIAFWLHLVTAPALLYATLCFVFLGDFANDTLFSSNKGLRETAVIVAVVLVLMVIGLVIDRRAFVTSGLLSLGLATASLLQQMEAPPENYVFLTLLIVGLVVLTIGIGWPHFRRWAVTPMPVALKEKLPPLR